MTVAPGPGNTPWQARHRTGTGRHRLTDSLPGANGQLNGLGVINRHRKNTHTVMRQATPAVEYKHLSRRYGMHERY